MHGSAQCQSRQYGSVTPFRPSALVACLNERRLRLSVLGSVRRNWISRSVSLPCRRGDIAVFPIWSGGQKERGDCAELTQAMTCCSGLSARCARRNIRTRRTYPCASTISFAVCDASFSEAVTISMHRWYRREDKIPWNSTCSNFTTGICATSSQQCAEALLRRSFRMFPHVI